MTPVRGRSRPSLPRPTTRLLPPAACVLALAACGPRTPRAEGTAAARSDTLLPVNGTRLWVHRKGQGPPLVVVHGGPVLDQTYLRTPLAPLGRDRELVYYDQRLSGRSEGVVDSASVRLDVFVEDIEALRTALGLGRIDLLGHSWGGLLALHYALRYPDHLRRLVLVSPMAPSATLWQEEERVLAAGLEPADTAGAGGLRASAGVAAGEPRAIEALLRLSFRAQFHDPDRSEDLEFHIEPDYRERSRQFGYMLPELLAYDLTDRLGEVRAPTLLIFGEEEPGGRIGGEALRKGIPDVTSVTLPDAGHFSFVEAPERFAAEVRAFLSGR